MSDEKTADSWEHYEKLAREGSLLPQTWAMLDLRRRLASLERGARLNLRECRGARGVDVGANPDAVCEVVGASAVESDPLGWASEPSVANMLIMRGHGVSSANHIAAHVFNELRRQWKERGR